MHVRACEHGVQMLEWVSCWTKEDPRERDQLSGVILALASLTQQPLCTQFRSLSHGNQRLVLVLGRACIGPIRRLFLGKAFYRLFYHLALSSTLMLTLLHQKWTHRHALRWQDTG